VAEKKSEALDAAYAELHRDHPFHEPADFVTSLRTLINGRDFKSTLEPDRCERSRFFRLPPCGRSRAAARRTTFSRRRSSLSSGARWIGGARAIRIKVEKYEIIDPKVQHSGDLAVLTFNIVDYGAQLDGGPKNTLQPVLKEEAAG
jgi:hypothetical protein